MRRLIEGQVRAWEAGDAAGIASAFDDPCEFIVPGVKLTTPDQIRRAAEAYFAQYTEIRISVREIICQGTSAAIEWHWTERSRQSRQVSEADDVIVVRCRDGKIAYWREYIDGPCRRLRR